MRVTPAAEVSCAADLVGAERGERFTRGADVGEWRWIASPDDVVRCDAPGFEPVDISGRGVGAASTGVVMAKGREVVIDAPNADSLLTVEWRTEDGGEPASRLLASRRTDLGRPLRVAATGRILRVRRPGASPVSFRLPDDGGSWRLRLPPPAGGGELVGRVRARRYQPERLLLEAGDESRPIEIRPDGLFQVVGARPGAARLAPVYRGGVRGEASDVTIMAGETTERWGWRLPQTGAAEIVPDDSLCTDSMGALSVTLLAARDGGRAWIPLASHDLETCIVLFEGLPPGDYRVDLSGTETSRAIASVKFAVAPEETTTAALRAARVAVHGQVTFRGGRPAADLALQFLDDSGTGWDTRTDSSGQFQVELGRPGEYTVAAKSLPYLAGAVFTRTYRNASEESDFELSGGVLHITVAREDGSTLDSPVQIQVRGPVRREGFVSPEDAADFTVFGLEFGGYTVTADGPPSLSCAQPVEVELSETSPEASATVLLTTATAARLRVFGPDGRPVPGVRAQVGARVLDEEESGVFRLDRVSAGAELRLVSPRAFLSTCRSLQTGGLRDVQVALEPRGGEALKLVTPTPAEGVLGALGGLPGAECPVPCVDLGATEQPSGHGSLIAITGLPPGRYLYSRRATTIQVEVPGPPVFLPPAPAQ